MPNSTKMKRGRGRNFTDKEKEILLDLINQDNFRYIIENRKLDHRSIQIKNQVWLQVTNLFNAKTGGDRPTIQLKTFHENYRVKCKKQYEHETAPLDYELLSKKDRTILFEIVDENFNIENNQYDDDQLRKNIWEKITIQFNSKVLKQKDEYCLKKNYEHYILKRKKDKYHEIQDINNEFVFKKTKVNANEEMHNLRMGHVNYNVKEEIEQGNMNIENYADRMPSHVSSYKINGSIDYSSSINDISETQNDNTNDSTMEESYEQSMAQKYLHVTESSNVENYFILKTQLLEEESKYKKQEFENKQKEFQERLKIIQIEQRIKENELKLKEIETEIKLEELKQLQSRHR